MKESMQSNALFGLAFSALVLVCCSFSTSLVKHSIGSSKLFENTPMESIHNRIFFGDTSGLRMELSSLTKEEINFQEEVLGATILNWASYNNFGDGVKILCEFGADPNLASNEGWTPLLSAVGIARNIESASILLKAGADPFYTIMDGEKMPSKISPMHLAARNQLEMLKLILNCGVDANTYDSTSLRTSPLAEASSAGQIHNVNYLIFVCKVDFKQGLIRKQDGSFYYLTDLLREMVFELTSTEYHEKMKLVAFLKEQGIDYFQTPIPEYIKKSYDEDYLSKY